MRYFLAILERDINLAFSKKSGLLHFLAFFLIIITLFSLSISPDSDILVKIAPGVVLVAVMLVNTLALPSLFEIDAEEGVLEQYLLLPCLPSTIIMAKTLAHWITTSVPIIVLSPIVSLMLGLSVDQSISLVVALLLATPTISCIGLITASLAVGSKRSSLIFSVLSLPLYIPVLIFAASSHIIIDGMATSYIILIALFLIMFPISIITSSFSLKNYLN